MYRLSHYINIIYNTFVMHDNVSELSKNQTEESSWDGQQEYYWAGGGGGGASTSLRSTKSRPYFCFDSSDT